MPQTPPDRPDEMLGEHYRIERELGHGGMATVYLCTDIRDGSRVAVKVLRPELGSVVTRERFFREITFASQLDHPRIPRVKEHGTTADGLPFYAMNFIEGESLRDRMIRDPKMAVDEVVRITAAIAAPMGYAHERHIVHRDIKPENILLSGDKVFVLDFGVARAIAGAAGDRLTRTGIVLGTPAYMSPEQVQADGELDPRSDLYSLACVVYEMLAGEPPFTGGSPRVLMAARVNRTPKPLGSVREDVPENVSKAVEKAMARLPEKRWETVDAFVDAMLPPSEPGEAQDQSGDGTGAAAPINEMLEQLRTSFSGFYEVLSEMKSGGMSRLFLASDLALRRRVVIKILPPEILSPMMLARFRREAEVTAALQHPHILPVISAGQKDGLVYYIMPFIEGESLRGLLDRDKQLPIQYALRILREMTDALAYAHRLGVIHRDIKPENVLLQDGHAVLADFGIAAAVAGDSNSETGERLTGTGMSLGTVGYMAPEQALGGRAVDARADIYSAGVVGYELFAGEPPFTGATDQAILIAHLTREAPLVDDVRPDTPEPVALAIKRAMQKDPELRFQNSAEFRDAIDSAMSTSPGIPSRPASATNTKPALAAVPAVPEVSEEPVKKRPRASAKTTIVRLVAALVVLAAVGTAIVKLRARANPAEGVLVAVAPFNALTSDAGLWREGMVDVLARYLDGVGPLRTVSPSIAIKGFPDKTDSASTLELARQTRAKYAIWGSVTAVAGGATIRATLIDVENNSTTPLSVDDTSVEGAAGKLASMVLTKLGKKYTLGAVKDASFGSKNIDATRAFLKGEQFFRNTAWDSAGKYYDVALKSDSAFAIALRRSAQVTGWQKNAGDSTARSNWLKAGAYNHGQAARDSLLLTSDSIMAALATLRSDSMDWQKVTRLFATVNDAAVRYPDDPEVWYTVGEARFHHGFGTPANVTERMALEAFDRSITLDSAFAPAYVHAVELAFTLDGADAGEKYVKKYLALNPTDVEAQGLAIVDKVAGPGGTDQKVLDDIFNNAPTDAIMAAYFTLRRWPDTDQTALRLLRAPSQRPSNTPNFAADSARVWNFLPLELAYRGHLAEAYQVMGNRPSRLFVELAMLGGIPPAIATAQINNWVDSSRAQAFFALPYLAQTGNIAAIQKLNQRAQLGVNSGSELAKKGARYRVNSSAAYLSLAKHDTADALKRFSALADTSCLGCYLDRLEAARLFRLKSDGLDRAADLLGQRLNSLITPAEIMIAMERGRVAMQRKNTDEALRAFKLVVAAWSSGDSSLQGFVREARENITKLGG